MLATASLLAGTERIKTSLSEALSEVVPTDAAGALALSEDGAVLSQPQTPKDRRVSAARATKRGFMASDAYHAFPRRRASHVRRVSSVALVSIQIDADALQGASSERQREWQLAIDELLEEHTFSGLRVETTLTIAIDAEAAYLMWSSSGASPFATSTLLRAHLTNQIEEYVDICKRLGSLEEGSASSQLEALDMAKRVTHDAAAKVIARQLTTLGPDHPTARRLFTLLLTLFIDTTKLSMVHRHRRAAR